MNCKQYFRHAKKIPANFLLKLCMFTLFPKFENLKIASNVDKLNILTTQVFTKVLITYAFVFVCMISSHTILDLLHCWLLCWHCVTSLRWSSYPQWIVILLVMVGWVKFQENQSRLKKNGLKLFIHRLSLNKYPVIFFGT